MVLQKILLEIFFFLKIYGSREITSYMIKGSSNKSHKGIHSYRIEILSKIFSKNISSFKTEGPFKIFRRNSRVEDFKDIPKNTLF